MGRFANKVRLLIGLIVIFAAVLLSLKVFGCDKYYFRTHVWNAPIVRKLRGLPPLPHSLQAVLDHWQLDQAWLEKAKSLTQGKDLVSIDIFDTTLTRDFERPIDLFAYVEGELLALSFKANGFAKARMAAEQAVRQVKFAQSHRSEVTFDEIYAQLRKEGLYDAACLAKAQQLEYTAERAHLHAVPDLLAFVDYLKEKHIPYCIVSDMYLPGKFLEDVMHQKGYSGWENFFVSGDIGKSKGDKDIWSLPYFQGKKIFHIGDNLDSDVKLPKTLGIETLHYARAMSKQSFKAALTPACVSSSQGLRIEEMESRKNAHWDQSL